MSIHTSANTSRAMRQALLFSVLIVASCGLVYELVAGTLSSYLLGDSVTQFSTIIGVYLFAMGVGSWVSKYITQHLVHRFIEIELMVGLIGGFSAVILFVVFAHIGYNAGTSFQSLLYLMVLIIGTLVGLEIPLVMRILEQELTLKDLVSQVLTLDYLGALAVSLAFPLILLPRLGLMRASLAFGLMNAMVALWTVWVFRAQLGRLKNWLIKCSIVIGLLVLGFVYANQLMQFTEEKLFDDHIIFAKNTQYQRIVLTQWRDDTR